MQDKPKLCKDCKNFSKGYYNNWCTTESGGIDLVTGKPKTFSNYAYMNRREYGLCKPEALLFKPKFSLLNWLSNLIKEGHGQ